MKTASASQQKWQIKAAASSQDYLTGAQNTSKDQAAAGAAAEAIYQSQLQASFAKKKFSAGLNKSGKAGWLKGVTQKGVSNFATGVSAEESASKYATESGKYDAARNAASGAGRGAKGSPQNLAKVSTVVTALRAIKVAA